MTPLLIYSDERTEVHVGDIVRYVRFDWGHYNHGWHEAGRFYRKTGTVTELVGTGAVGIHFPHYAKGTNLVAVDDAVRLVRCTHRPRHEGEQ